MEVSNDSSANKLEARLKLVTAMQAGMTWQIAAQVAALPISRTTAYRYLKNFRDKGEAALHDGRQGHPAKLKAAVQTWLVAYCQAHPDVTSSQLQTAIGADFGVAVGIRRLNMLRATLGITRQKPPKPLTTVEQAAPAVAAQTKKNLGECEELAAPQWLACAGSFIMLAAAQQTGLLDSLTQALPTDTAPATSRLAHQRPPTNRRLVQTLLFMAAAGQFRTWSLRSYTGAMLALLSGRTQAYSYRHTERFLSETAHAGGDAKLTEALAGWTYRLWHCQFQLEAEVKRGTPPAFYVDGHHKAVYSTKLIPRGLVGKLGRVLGCRGLVFLHDAKGHPLLATTSRGDQHLTVGLPNLVERFEQAVKSQEGGEQFKITRVIADREVMAGEFLAGSLAREQVVVTILKENQYQDVQSFAEVGNFEPWLVDRQGQVRREVAPASFQLTVTSPLTGKPLKLDVALIRDWRRLKPQTQTAQTPATPKLIPIVTTRISTSEGEGGNVESAAAFDGPAALELAACYRARWRNQENVFKDWLVALGLDVNHGFSKHAVANSEVGKRRAYLQQRITSLAKRATAAKLRSERAGELYRRRNTKLHQHVKQINRELNVYYEQLVAQTKYPPSLNSEEKAQYQEFESKINVELERLKTLEWAAYSHCNREYGKAEAHQREQKELQAQLEKLEAHERQMLELDNAKDQVMTCFTLALANLGMWVRERCFPANYAGCSWRRLLPFFELGGWVSTEKEVVRVELQAFNDRALNRDLAQVCELVTKAGLKLPDGRLLQIKTQVEPGCSLEQRLREAG